MSEGDQRFQQDLRNALQIQKNICEGLGILKDSVCQLRGHLKSSALQVEQLPGTNGTILGMQHVQTGKQQFENKLKILFEQVKIKNQQVIDMFKNLYSTLEGLVNCLTIQIKEWQSHFQLHYAKMMRLPPDLEKIAPWCAKVGQILMELLGESFQSWEKILKSIPTNAREIFLTEYQTQRSAFQNMMTGFIQSTFLVSEQTDFCIKTLKKFFPPFRIRLLAADYFYDHSGEVTAHFVRESDLRNCFHGDDLDIETLKKKEIKIVNKRQEKLELKSQKDTDKMECCCETLQFEKPFKRQKAKETKVHEDKFRVIFVTQMESKTFWTVSLPLLVICASNQECDSLASIMWQCTSTDVFSLKEETPAEMKWSSVACMLKQKMSVISQSHNLTEDNITHLKNRLFGVENQSDDALVTLTQFCCVPMQDLPKEKFSFWKWFLGIFNVIEDYLSKYWNDGLIMGFVERRDAEQMLLQCERSGTFILRFSDTKLIVRDGQKNVHGVLNPSVFCIKLTAKEMGKRNSTGQREVVTQKVVENLELPNPPENLANILEDERKKLYCYLYPGDKHRKELFNKYYIPDKVESTSLVKVYRHPSEVDPTIDDLERTMREISLIKGTGTSPQADTSLQSGDRIIKKPRRSKEPLKSGEGPIQDQTDVSSNITTNITTQNHSPLNLVQSTCAEPSPEHSSMNGGYLDQSPAQYVPNPTFHGYFTKELNQDSVVPDSPELLPTVLEDMDVLETATPSNSVKYRRKVCQAENHQKNLDKTAHSDNNTGEHFLVMDTPAVEISSNPNQDNISGLCDKSVLMGGGSAAVGGANVLNYRMDIPEYEPNMTARGVFASSEEVNQSVNDLILSLGGTSTQEGRANQTVAGNATSVVGAGAPVDGDVVSKGNVTTYQTVGNCVYEARSSKIYPLQNQQMQITLNCLEDNSRLSQSTLSELKRTLKLEQYRQVLLWTKKENDEVETSTPVTNAFEFGQEIADVQTDLDDLETDAPFYPGEEFSMESVNALAEHELSLEQYLNTELLSDDTIPDLPDLDNFLGELETA